MSAFEIVETPDLIMGKWLDDIDQYIAPFSVIDSTANQQLEELGQMMQPHILRTVDIRELTGPLLKRMFYQYSSIVGQIHLYSRLNTPERNRFLDRALKIYYDAIELIDCKYVSIIAP